MTPQPVDAIDAITKLHQLATQARRAGVHAITLRSLEAALGIQPPAEREYHLLVWNDAQSWQIQHPPGCAQNGTTCPAVRAAFRTLGDATLPPGRYHAWVGESGYLSFKPVVESAGR